MREWKDIHSLHFLPFSLLPPSLSISNIRNCLILLQNVKYGTFFANITKNLHTRYEKIILGRIRCVKAPQVVKGPGPSVGVLQQYSNFHVTCNIFISNMRCFSIGASL